MTTADRIEAGAVRAIDSYRSISRRADKLVEELDQTTDHGSVVPIEIHDEDSAVIALESAQEQHLSVAGGRFR